MAGRRRSLPVAPEDAALFRDAIGDVAPIAHDIADRRAPPPPPVPRQRLADEDAVRHELATQSLADIEAAMGEPLSYARDGVAPRVLRRLGRGEFSVRDEIDLHRMTAPIAARAVADFLDASRKAGRLCVKIIHGKGLRSKNATPVLRQVTEQVLRQRGDVLAYRAARAGDGGSGAVLVLLRRAG